MKFNVKALAITSGLFWGGSFALMTLWVLIFGESSNALLESFSDFYFGYSVSYKGVFVGLVYGFIDGLLCGGIFGWLYNACLEKCGN